MITENSITEVLEDGTIYHIDLNVCENSAMDALDNLYETEGKKLGFDYTTTVFNLFVASIQILTQSGWSTEELLSEVINHSQAGDICFCEDDGDDEDFDD